MGTNISKIAEIARNHPKIKFTSLYHLINEKLLVTCHEELEKDKAVGIDGMTKASYEENLKDNIRNLVQRLKLHAYKPQPVKRTYIPKGKGEKRPLGIPAYEDKIVQMALKKIVEAIFEQDFLDMSYGFRPNRGCHKAIIQLDRMIMQKTSYIVDADIKGFFNNVNHDWLIKFVSERISDPNIIRLIKKYLKAGILESGKIEMPQKGTPQGSILSPILANIYLHYVLDLWFEIIVKKRARGQAGIVRYADDFVCCFQYKSDAINFFADLKHRMNKFGLEIAEEESKIIEFGRFANTGLKKKAETFDFLGFTHYCSKSRKGYYQTKRKTSRKKLISKLKEFNQWMKEIRNQCRIGEIVNLVKDKLRGHYAYYGVSDNIEPLRNFQQAITRIMLKWLNKRSQRKSMTFQQFRRYLDSNPLPEPRIYVKIYNGTR